MGPGPASTSRRRGYESIPDHPALVLHRMRRSTETRPAGAFCSLDVSRLYPPVMPSAIPKDLDVTRAPRSPIHRLQVLRPLQSLSGLPEPHHPSKEERLVDVRDVLPTQRRHDPIAPQDLVLLMTLRVIRNPYYLNATVDEVWIYPSQWGRWGIAVERSRVIGWSGPIPKTWHF